ncbi:MotA/TolQ/ExbB proton channel family protein [Dethiosulfatarculus sandiegensis]|uniref:MotA n=1 Tax=Dethiosulfatarculus sandiegensis TaxID=1429043 RepID=A0A0D2K2L1_9BACT|nr:MotA/TolQ/ExbB proton channel family protein [Dethiosulfatarculus sandiegensis]KIX15875.1 MotA [Dethiosulfatarculus sandiegensis]
MKKLILAVCLCFAAFSLAQAENYPKVSRDVAKDLQNAAQEKEVTQKDIAHKKADLKNKLAELKQNLTREKARLQKATEDLAETSRKKAELSLKVEESSGDLNELAGHVRAAARDLLAQFERSPITAEYPERLGDLRAYLNKSRFPGLDDITRLVAHYFTEMKSSAEVKERETKIVNRKGEEAQAGVVRLGGFCALYRNGQEMGYLTLGPGTGSLLATSGEPDWFLENELTDYFDGKTAMAPMDISGGAALRQLARRVTFWEQVQSGGYLIWPILLVGAIAVLLIIERLIFLQRVRSNTDALMSKVNDLVLAGDMDEAYKVADAQSGRPTSNVIKAGLSLRECSGEVIENGLSEAMLRELPRLERFITPLKVLAAVAPLLGLLGTVTGMIKTFQVITVFGTGDPRLMAGGISEALVTTQLGLMVAIPVLVAAGLLGRRAQRIAGDMEEKAVSLSAALIRQGEKA